MKKTIQLNAGKVRYIDQGNGPVVLFVHGNPSSSEEFNKVIKNLQTDYRCIALDLIGFGDSDKPYEWDYLPISHAEVLQQFIYSLKLKDINFVFGDWGGPISISYIKDNPENTKSMIIMNTWAWPVNNDWYYRGFSGFMGGAIGRYLIKNHNFFAKVIAKKAFGNNSKFTKEIEEQFVNVHRNKVDRKSMWIFPKEIINSSKFLKSIWDKKDSFKSIPSLIIWGMKDIAFRPKELNVWEANLENFSSVKLDNVGHFPALEAPEIFIAKSRSFLNSIKN